MPESLKVATRSPHGGSSFLDSTSCQLRLLRCATVKMSIIPCSFTAPSKRPAAATILRLMPRPHEHMMCTSICCARRRHLTSMTRLQEANWHHYSPSQNRWTALCCATTAKMSLHLPSGHITDSEIKLELDEADRQLLHLTYIMLLAVAAISSPSPNVNSKSKGKGFVVILEEILRRNCF
jgi:hypothetical protein